MPSRSRRTSTNRPIRGISRTAIRTKIIDRSIVNSEAVMTLIDRVNQETGAAMKAQQPARLSALRMLKAAIMNKEVAVGHDLDDAEVLQVVASLVKQRRDSIEQFTKAGRQDLVDKETAEIRVLEEYQPPAATPDEIAAAVAAAITETGATSAKDIGKVMKAVMPKLAGKSADGRAVNETVRAKLSGA